MKRVNPELSYETLALDAVEELEAKGIEPRMLQIRETTEDDDPKYSHELTVIFGDVATPNIGKFYATINGTEIIYARGVDDKIYLSGWITHSPDDYDILWVTPPTAELVH